MTETQSKGKTAGKLIAAVSFLLLLAVLAVSWYINGQTRVIEKYCAALAMGSYSDYEETVSLYRENSFALKEDFKADCRSRFEALPEFSELSETDSIKSQVKVTEHRMNGSFTDWVCTADVDFFSGAHSISRKAVSFNVRFTKGKWLVGQTDETIRYLAEASRK